MHIDNHSIAIINIRFNKTKIAINTIWTNSKIRICPITREFISWSFKIPCDATGSDDQQQNDETIRIENLFHCYFKLGETIVINRLIL